MKKSIVFNVMFIHPQRLIKNPDDNLEAEAEAKKTTGGKKARKKRKLSKPRQSTKHNL
jgi:hypothetical protein